MLKLHIATLAQCDEDGNLYISVFNGTESEVLDLLNRVFEQEARDGHETGASFDSLADADGYDSFDSNGANHYRVLVTTAEIPEPAPVYATDDKDIVLDTIRNWANNSCAYLSDKPGYAKGYKDGIMLAKDSVREMLNCTQGDRYADVVTSFHDDEKGAWAVDAYLGPDPDADDAGRTVAWIRDDGTVEWKDDSAKSSALVKEAIAEKIKELKG